MPVEIRRLAPGDEAAVLAAGHLFDGPPRPEATARFLAEPTHHLLVAYEDGEPAGFVTGVETTHPDKGTEMFLYEIGVDEPARRRGTGTALCESPKNPDVLWAGTDDGAVWLTRDGCKTWTNLSDKFKAAGLPEITSPRGMVGDPATTLPRPPVDGFAPSPTHATAGTVTVPVPVARAGDGGSLAAAAAAGHSVPVSAAPMGWLAAYRSGYLEICTVCASSPTGLVCQFGTVMSRSRNAPVALTGSSATAFE